MKNTAKLIVVFIFVLGALFLFLSSNGLSRIGAVAFSGAVAELTPTKKPTPPKNTNTKPTNANAVRPANSAANAVNGNMTVNANMSTFPFGKPSPTMTTTPSGAPANTAPGAGTQPTGGKTIQKLFILGKDSQTEYGEAPFDHDNHAFKNYSPDGKSVVGCVECHHTDQPKSALKPPLFTSERNEILTMAVYQKSSQKVSGCRDCHFQDGNVPDGKTMPVDAKGKALDNQLAYHLNCNVCHDDTNRLRPDIKAKNKTFAIGRDCYVCHKSN
ncbi:MAG: cytochrome c3 family protein [Pyrinomonadaceae bacterium]